jgi:hypothetical protein
MHLSLQLPTKNVGMLKVAATRAVTLVGEFGTSPGFSMI